MSMGGESFEDFDLTKEDLESEDSSTTQCDIKQRELDTAFEEENED